MVNNPFVTFVHFQSYKITSSTVGVLMNEGNTPIDGDDVMIVTWDVTYQTR